MITIGFSTRKIDDSFVELLKKTCGLPNVEIIPIENNGEYSLTQAYNIILNKSKFDVLVLCHDDIYFETKNWGNKLLNHFKRNQEFGVLGVAGSQQLPSSAKWWEDFTKMKGIVNHDSGGKKWESKYSVSKGNQLDEVVLIDGLFMAFDKKRIKTKFNEQVEGFHFYDVDFSFRNFLEGVKVGVMYDIRITHKSVGQTNDQWELNRQKFAETHKDVLPKKIFLPIKNNPNFRIFVTENNFSKSFELIELLLNNKFQVSFLGNSDQSLEVRKLKNKGVKFYDFKEPYGFKLGDGKWGFNGPNGYFPSEKGKKYQIKEFDYNIIHNINDSLIDVLKQLYPKSVIFTQNETLDSLDDIINEYNKLIND
jgi:hypothetical protein